jgi:uncharacterized membrane protein YhaH (DUF805 family)
MNWYLEVLKKYAVFSGRARRKEYWMFVLFNVIIMVALNVVGGIVGDGGIVGSLYSLGVLVPSVAAGIRRMHDTDRSGWWLLVPIANLIFAVTEGQPGPNKYGPSPKAGETMMAASRA